MSTEDMDTLGAWGADRPPPDETLPRRIKDDDDKQAQPRWLQLLHRDLEVLTSPSSSTTLASAMGGDLARLRGGRAYVEAVLSRRPDADLASLRRRQAALKRLEAAGLGGGGDDDEGSSAKLTRLEDDVLWFFRLDEDEGLREIVDASYFGWPGAALNRRSPLALSARAIHQVVISPLIGVLSPIVYFVVPYLVLKLTSSDGHRLGFVEYLCALAKSGIGWAQGNVSLGRQLFTRGTDSIAMWVKIASSLLSLAMYFSSVISSFQLSSSVRRVCRTVSDRVDGATEFFREAVRRAQAVGWNAEAAEAWFPEELGRCRLGFPLTDPAGLPPRWIKRLGPLEVDLSPGHRLRAAATFDRAAAEGALRCAYAVDALAAVLRAKASRSLCWVEYADDAAFELRGLRHPCLESRKTRANDWALERHVLLTGPNAGGKSTLMKALLCAALTAQTLGVAAADSCRLSPFSVISSHLNVADAAGTESLFQAEMARAQRVIADLDGNGKNDAHGNGNKSLVVIDEIFSSTNPVEGIAAAAAVARRIAACPGAISVTSTHFLHLCRLLRGTHASYGMPVELDGATGAVLSYPYRLVRGPCRQYIALELMRGSGFDEGVTADAIEVKRALLRSSKKKKKSEKPQSQ
jgi:energy-coupling factor transporter ATP-binding protein EcfA2